MPLDHYISQVHLKLFNSPALGDRVYAIRKSDLRTFTPNTKRICVITDGSTNAYLRDDRKIEEFLKTVEPNYNRALQKLRTEKIDAECIYTIAGFIAFVISCSPAAMRIHAGPLKKIVESTAELLENRELLPPPPPELGGKTLFELLKKGTVRVTVDEKYPQAIGIDQILQSTAMFGNFRWEILHNPFNDSPFFTSDFPAAIERTNDLRVLNRIVPLAPDLALRVHPNIMLDRENTDFAFQDFQCRSREVDRGEVRNLNRLIVQCAEETVFYRDDMRWIGRFVARNSGYRIEPQTVEFPTEKGVLFVSTQRIKIKPRGWQTQP